MSKMPRGRTFLPDHLQPAHHLCMFNHDILVELLRSGERSKIFSHRFRVDQVPQQALEDGAEILDWLERTGRTRERNRVLRATVFPALLSDFLHFVFEALETSRKAKLNVSYALIRKPLQESLFLLEIIATDIDKFGQHLAENPMLLRAQKAGGLPAHTKRIAKSLDVLRESDRFDANYLAQLRYGRTEEDSFDGPCNQAMHLFTEHPAIKTDKLNINFIFSDWDSKLTQWYYLYSRLPYVLCYARRLVEHVCASLAQTDPRYLKDMERRVAAATILWAGEVEARYQHPKIDQFVDATRVRLLDECQSMGCRSPTTPDLIRMRDRGALPGEPVLVSRFRNTRYSLLGAVSKVRRLASKRRPTSRWT